MMQTLSIDSLTETVVEAMGPKTAPRTREVMSALIRHVHEFAREVNLTTKEWLAGVALLNRAGQMSDDRRNEMILVSDVLGLESLVDALDHEAAGAETESAVLGPFYRTDAPVLLAGASIVQGGVPGETVYVSGRVTSSTGEPLAGAILDIWETSPNGLYEQQDADQPEMNLRGRFQTDAHGNYSYRALRPVSYPIPYDGPAGDLLQMMDRHPYRPAHIHLIVSADGHRSLVTQIFDRTDKYLSNDSVFAVKDSLIIDFTPAPAGADTDYVVDYDICLKAEPARELASV